MQPADIFVLDGEGAVLYAPLPLPGRPSLKLSQCAPLFQCAFTARNAGACIHTHALEAVLCTLHGGGRATEFTITHQEMIKGVAGHGFLDSLVVPIIENTPHEADLAESLRAAMDAYPRSNAVLVRRHGVYVWGDSWEAAKTQAECYHYLFQAAVEMRRMGLEPGAAPSGAARGIGAGTAYGSGGEKRSEYEGLAAAGTGGHAHAGGCCGTGGAGGAGEGWLGAAGTSALPPPPPQQQQQQEQQQQQLLQLPAPGSYSHVSFDANHPCAPKTPRPEKLKPSPDPYTPLNPSKTQVVLDVEGCTTSLQFVSDTLFPFASAEVARHFSSRLARGAAGRAEAVADARALVAQWEADVAAGGAEGAPPLDCVPAALEEAGEGGAVAAAAAALAANVRWQMSSDRKAGALKALQGHIWRAGYECGTLAGHVFPDVAPALARWGAAGKRVYVYSSGSREAQALLFRHATGGDLTPLFCGHFDTRSGPKLEAASYRDIALSLGVGAQPSRALFLTDSLGEAAAAAEAGWQVVVTVRPGNNALPACGAGFPTVESFTELV
jgi:2,3-diketo-5-methylthio-1-phosphopentane phosphatase/methylthioribulose-1-phosphate dehydratase